MVDDKTMTAACDLFFKNEATAFRAIDFAVRLGYELDVEVQEFISQTLRAARAERFEQCRTRISYDLRMPPVVRAPRGREISCKGWHQEAALRMLMNNLDPEVAEKPDELIVYGGTGRAARDWPSFHAIVRSLQQLENDETLLVQSGKPVGIFRTHSEAPRVLIANSNLVGHWSNYEEFNRLERLGLIMYGQMTAGSWIYIGSQGIVQGTFETFAAAANKSFGGSLRGKLVVSGGMGGMGGAQPLAATLNGA